MTHTPRIGIIISTTRANRFADKPTEWLLELAQQRNDAQFEIVDLRNHPLPFLDEGPGSTDPVVAAWADKMAELDGYVFITAEYNHGIPAVLKNAIDHAHSQYNRKPAAFVGYGGVGGARAVEQLRLVLAEMQVATIKHAVHINAGEFVPLMRDERNFADYPYLGDAATAMLDDLLWWTTALKTARAA